jgi:hypothetical protein
MYLWLTLIFYFPKQTRIGEPEIKYVYKNLIVFHWYKKTDNLIFILAN